MTETTPERDFVCRLTAWSFVVLAGFAIVAIVHVATHGGNELSDGWPVFLVFGAAFGVNSMGIIAQGDIRLRGITTVKRSDSPFLFWSLVVPGIVLAIVAVGLGIWGGLK